jgi:hypothetical protein
MNAAVDLPEPTGTLLAAMLFRCFFRVAAGQVGVGAVAERRCAGPLAQAEERFFPVTLGDVRDRLETGAGVRAVAEGLSLRATAAAPQVASPGDQFLVRGHGAGDARLCRFV